MTIARKGSNRVKQGLGPKGLCGDPKGPQAWQVEMRDEDKK